MSRARPIRMWAVKGPRGNLLRDTVDPMRFNAQELACANYTDWQSMKRQGYRLVRVRVEEVG